MDNNTTSEEKLYPAAASAAEQRRCFILEKFAGSELTMDALIRGMDAVETWIVSGKVPGMAEVKPLKNVNK